MCSQRTFHFRNQKRQAGELSNSRSRCHSRRTRTAKAGPVQGHFTVHVGDAFSGRVNRRLPVGADLQAHPLPELQGWVQLSLSVHPSPNPQHLPRAAERSLKQTPGYARCYTHLAYEWTSFVLNSELWPLGLGLGWSGQAPVLVLSKRQKEMPQARPFTLEHCSGWK